jgi:Tfp pilus assembly protein PilE
LLVTATFPVANASVFTVQAVPIGAPALDTHCAKMRLTNTGVKTSKDSGGATSTRCW